jgi:hypothetical protein
MALQKDFDVEYAATYTLPWKEEKETRTYKMLGAYIKVLTTSGCKNHQKAVVSIVSGDKQIIKEYFFSPSVSDGSGNFIKQAYTHLRTLPEFSGATDC